MHTIEASNAGRELGTESTSEPPPRGRARAWTPHLRHLVVVYLLCGLASTLTNSPGRGIADARVEYSTNPIDFLTGHAHLWDAGRGLGNTTTFYSPVLGAYQALLQLVGAEPWLIERMVHAALLTLAASGLAALLAVMRPRLTAVHLLAGLIYAFNPYTSQFLLPSGLFLSYALAPWFLVVYLRGTRDRDAGWRMAAWFALGIFAVGALNPAALAYALLPVPIAAAYLVFVERSMPLRPAFTWLLRAGLLAGIVSCGALVVLWFQRSDITFNLATTERPEVVSSRSSWSESWRGLGLWTTYYRDSGGQLQAQSASYFRNPLVVVASYGAPLAAALAVALSRWRPRLYFAALVGLAVPIMVGVWPTNSPSPLGRLLDWGFENAVVVRGLRTTYKVGSVFYMGVAVLAAVAIGGLLRRDDGDPESPVAARVGRRAVGTGLVGMVAVAAFPFWTGSLYNEAEGFDDIPAYWDEAFDWIGDQPADGRVLVLPGVVRTRYRWGYVNDNLFHGLLDKSLVSHQSIPPPGTPLAADVVLALDDYLASPAYEPGVIGPVLRRLGVRWVLFQNDVDWQQVGVPRPSHYDPVRDDPDLTRIATFGGVGENTTSGFQDGSSLVGESELHPVEIFEVTDARDTVRVSTGRPVVVAGAGDAWPQLARQGFLDGGPVLYTGEADDDTLAEAVLGGSPVVVTDGSRRRYVQVRTGRMAFSNTLALDEASPRAPQSRFGGDASLSYAVYEDARSIEASRTGNGIAPFDPSQRPANAFDGLEHTSWTVTGSDVEGARVMARLDEPTSVRQVSILPDTGSESRSVDRIRVELTTADGTSIDATAEASDAGPTGWITLDVGAENVSEVIVELERLAEPSLGSAGLAEVLVEGADGPLDLREMLRTPVDLRDAADRNQDVDDGLADADVSYSFRRSIGTGIGDEETDLRRIFWAVRDDVVDVRGTVRLTDRTPDVTVDRLVGGVVGAFGSDRSPGALDGWGVNVVDGDPTTSWLAPPTTGTTLTVRAPDGPLETIEFVAASNVVEGDVGRDFSRVEAATVTATGPEGTVTIEVRPGDAVCARDDGVRRCTETFVAELPAAMYDTVVFRLDSVEALDGLFAMLPVAVDEVLFDGRPAPIRSDGNRCAEAFDIDGAPTSVRLVDSTDELLDGEPVGFESCETVVLTEGEHRFESGPLWSGAISELVMSGVTTRPPSEPGSTPSVEIIERSPTRVVLEVTAPAGSHLIGPGAYHPGWTATLDGEPLGDAVARDALSAWRLPGVERARIELRFRPQRTYELALAISAAGVAICLYLVSRVRRP